MANFKCFACAFDRLTDPARFYNQQMKPDYSDKWAARENKGSKQSEKPPGNEKARPMTYAEWQRQHNAPLPRFHPGCVENEFYEKRDFDVDTTYLKRFMKRELKAYEEFDSRRNEPDYVTPRVHPICRKKPYGWTSQDSDTDEGGASGTSTLLSGSSWYNSDSKPW